MIVDTVGVTLNARFAASHSSVAADASAPDILRKRKLHNDDR